MSEQFVVPGPWEVRSESERILSARVVPYDVVASVGGALEMFTRGALADATPADVVLRMDHADPPAGRGLSIEERDDGAYMEFRVARTPRGEELLASIAEDIYRNVSVGFDPMPGGTEVRSIGGRPVNVRTKINLAEVSTTWRPVYMDAAILAVRSHMGGNEEMTEATAPASDGGAPNIQAAPSAATNGSGFTDLAAAIMHRLDGLEERSRQNIQLPPGIGTATPEVPRMADWAAMAVRHIGGERVSDLEMRALADVLTTTNLGVVPPAYSAEMLGVIDNARPFLESTDRMDAPASGTTLRVPRLTQRPLVGEQLTEKAEVASRATTIDVVEFTMRTVAGAGDISLQLLMRSSPEFLDLWLRLLGEAYALTAEEMATDALLASGINAGGVFNPASPTLGAAFRNSMTAVRRPPDRVWLSSEALARFIDAKEPTGGGGRPLYPGLAEVGTITVAPDGQTGPRPMVLRPVHVPALDVNTFDADTATVGTQQAHIVIGPSTGFAWAEAGTYTLQADVPSKAGRDVGLVGFAWFVPRYPAAFTAFTLA